MTIVLLDPSLGDHNGNMSINLGDVIIYESIREIMHALFPDEEIVRISTHKNLEQKHYSQIAGSRLVFFGGTNVLSSNVDDYNQWKIGLNGANHLSPYLKNIVLLGVGWWQYQESVAEPSKKFYSQVLHHQKWHSVRDSYTQKKLTEIGFANTLNTTCPTMWKLDGLDTTRTDFNVKDCLLCLTDYKPDPVADTQLIRTILHYYQGHLYFFPQGSQDESYINSLEIFRANRRRIQILEHSVDAFYKCIKTNNKIDYIGTRLHGGTKCLEQGIKSVIIAVDNRSAEIAKDVNLPVVGRSQLERLVEWLEGKSVFEPIKLPLKAIDSWKKQWSV